MSYIGTRLIPGRIPKDFTHAVRPLPGTHDSTVGTRCSVFPYVTLGALPEVGATGGVPGLVGALKLSVRIQFASLQTVRVSAHLSVLHPGLGTVRALAGG